MYGLRKKDYIFDIGNKRNITRSKLEILFNKKDIYYTDADISRIIEPMRNSRESYENYEINDDCWVGFLLNYNAPKYNLSFTKEIIDLSDEIYGYWVYGYYANEYYALQEQITTYNESFKEKKDLNKFSYSIDLAKETYKKDESIFDQKSKIRVHKDHLIPKESGLSPNIIRSRHNLIRLTEEFHKILTGPRSMYDPSTPDGLKKYINERLCILRNSKLCCHKDVIKAFMSRIKNNIEENYDEWMEYNEKFVEWISSLDEAGNIKINSRQFSLA